MSSWLARSWPARQFRDPGIVSMRTTTTPSSLTDPEIAVPSRAHSSRHLTTDVRFPRPDIAYLFNSNERHACYESPLLRRASGQEQSGQFWVRMTHQECMGGVLADESFVEQPYDGPATCAHIAKGLPGGQQFGPGSMDLALKRLKGPFRAVPVRVVGRPPGH
jgi:hypothetical protein